MPIPKAILNSAEGALTHRCILHAYRGSIAHGMWEPNDLPGSIDDKDTMAVCVPPLNTYFGLAEFGSRGTVEIVDDPWDIVIYETRKFVEMLAKGNPNVLSMLWLEPKMFLKIRPAGQLLLDNRDVFIGRHVRQPFVGYAKSQFYKMEHGAHEGYMGEKRKRLVEQYGYDTKNAAHLIRLLRMGIEFLKDGEMIVDRGGYDATELLSIKHGEWTLEQVKAEAKVLFARADAAYDRSALPKAPDMSKVDALCVEVVRTGMGL